MAINFPDIDGCGSLCLDWKCVCAVVFQQTSWYGWSVAWGEQMTGFLLQLCNRMRFPGLSCSTVSLLSSFLPPSFTSLLLFHLSQLFFFQFYFLIVLFSSFSSNIWNKTCKSFFLNHLTQYSGSVLLQMTGLCYSQIVLHVYVYVCVCIYVYIILSPLLSWGYRLSMGLDRACSTSGLYTQSSFYLFFGG